MARFGGGYRTGGRGDVDDEFEERVVRTNKVQKTHKGGRTLSWSTLVVVGNRKGRVGVGLGKARGIPDAIRKGIDAAKKSMIDIPMLGSTIPHDIVCRHGAATVMLKPASPGTGVVAGGSVRAILEVGGVKDVLAKSLGSPNPINNAWATMECLRQLRDVAAVARRRGREPNDLIPWYYEYKDAGPEQKAAGEDQPSDEQAAKDAEADA
jgi:small subunit ribosomal protein S5